MDLSSPAIRTQCVAGVRFVSKFNFFAVMRVARLASRNAALPWRRASGEGGAVATFISAVSLGLSLSQRIRPRADATYEIIR